MNFFVKILILVSILSSFCIFQPVFAKNIKEQFNDGLNATAKKTGHTELAIFKDGASLPQVIGQVIKFLLSFLGIFFLGLIIYGGFLWMTDRGNQDQVKKAQSVLRNAVIGLIIVLAAYGITAYIMELLTSKL